MNRYCLLSIVLALIICSKTVSAGVTDELIEFKADKEFKPLLEAVPMLLDAGGAKCLKRPDGSLWIVSVGTTVVKKPDSPRELMRRRIVALAKARAHAVTELNGNNVTVTSVLTTKDEVIVEDGVERGKSTEELEEKIVIEAKGIIKMMPEVASWMNKNAELYYIAIGKRLK